MRPAVCLTSGRPDVADLLRTLPPRVLQVAANAARACRYPRARGWEVA